MKGTEWMRSLAKSGLVCLAAACGLMLLMGQGCPSEEPPPPDPEESQFVGAAFTDDEPQGCQRCHSGHYNDWVATKHAGALGTLKAIGQDKNAICLPCHTVGFGEEGGFTDEASTAHLAGVQCENCHGAGREHVNNVDTVRPIRSIGSDVCGKCHNDTHHPTYDEWQESLHALVNEDTAESFAAGSSLANCGLCHSGDYRDQLLILGVNPVPATLLQGKSREEMNGITCVICHDPHAQTGNNAVLDEEAEAEESQLRFAEVASPVQSNTIADNTNPARYNLCGQCHHSRGRTWKDTSRSPHHSLQANMYAGEMPLPNDDLTLLVPNTNSAHRFVAKQCVTCHMPTVEFQSDLSPAESGHTFELKSDNCSAVGCHPSIEITLEDMDKLHAFVEAELDEVLERLGPATTWEYVASGGPADQTTVSDSIKKARFLYYWIVNDGSKGVHNPEYTRRILTEIDDLLTSAGK